MIEVGSGQSEGEVAGHVSTVGIVPGRNKELLIKQHAEHLLPGRLFTVGHLQGFASAPDAHVDPRRSASRKGEIHCRLGNANNETHGDHFR